MSASTSSAEGPKTRNTRQKRIVEAVLEQCDEFVSAQELHQLILNSGETVSLATVYRILQNYQQDGLADVIRTQDGESLFRICEDTGHHHHLVCRQCGTAVELHAPAIEKWADRVAEEHGFTQIEHTVEIFGVCARCSSKS